MGFQTLPVLCGFSNCMVMVIMHVKLTDEEVVVIVWESLCQYQLLQVFISLITSLKNALQMKPLAAGEK